MRHYKKNSRRAYLVRIAPINGIRNCCQAGLGRANDICRRAPNNRFRPFAEIRLRVLDDGS